MLISDEARARAEEQAGRTGDACAMVIFGASGDLTKRKLIPALYNLAKENLLSKEFALIGFARSEMSSEDFRKLIGDELNQFATTTVDPELWHWLSRRIYYVSGNVDDPKSYEKLKIQLAAVDQEHGTRGTTSITWLRHAGSV